MRLLIAPDKFKGSLSAVEAAAAIAAGFTAGWPTDLPLQVRSIPMADGGEGTAAALCDAVGGAFVSCPAHDALGRAISARYVVANRHQRLAIVEVSEASGLARIALEQRDPLLASSFGSGELLRHAVVNSRADVVIMGLGGSATNDGGCGLARALGYGFVDDGGSFIATPRDLVSLARIVVPTPRWPPSACRIVIASDVSNPLLGERGATAVFGPQKGLVSQDDRDRVEAGLKRLADVVTSTFGVDHRDRAGAGAAGGLGFGVLSFLNTETCSVEIGSGFDVVAHAVRLDEAIAWADVVVTGEGRLDAQTLDGKAPLGVAAMAHRQGKLVLAFAGRIEGGAVAKLRQYFDELIELSSVDASLSAAEAMAQAGRLLTECATRTARAIAARR